MLVFLAALILTGGIFLVGYVAQVLFAFVAISFELPGPLTEGPIAWVWFAVSASIYFAISLAFCSWLVRRVERKVISRSTFE